MAGKYPAGKPELRPKRWVTVNCFTCKKDYQARMGTHPKYSRCPLCKAKTAHSGMRGKYCKGLMEP